MRRSSVLTILLSALVGAAVAFMLDPRLGARRRALMRDKLRHYSRVVPRQVRRMARQVPGRVQRVQHALVQRAPWYEPSPPPDGDEYVKHRVETELGRQTDLPLAGILFDAADGIVHIRGTVADAATAERIVQRTAAVPGVRAVVSLLHTPDGTRVGGVAGDRTLVDGRPRAAVQAEAVRNRLKQRWPQLTDADILASDGHIGRLTELIRAHTGEDERAVRAELDSILLAAV